MDLTGSKPLTKKKYRKIGKKGSFSMPANLDTTKDWYIGYIDGQLIVGEHQDLPPHKKYKLHVMVKKNSKYITLGSRLQKKIKAFSLVEGTTMGIEEIKVSNGLKYRLTLEDYECDLCKRIIHVRENYYCIVGNEEHFIKEAGEIAVQKSEWFFLCCKTCAQTLNVSSIDDLHRRFRNGFLNIFKEEYEKSTH